MIYFGFAILFSGIENSKYVGIIEKVEKVTKTNRFLSFSLFQLFPLLFVEAY